MDLCCYSQSLPREIVTCAVIFSPIERTLVAAGHLPSKICEVYWFIWKGWQLDKLWLWQTHFLRAREEFATSISWSSFQTSTNCASCRLSTVKLLWIECILEIFFTGKNCRYFPPRRKWKVTILDHHERLRQSFYGRLFTNNSKEGQFNSSANNIHEEISSFWLVKSSAVFFENSAEKR